MQFIPFTLLTLLAPMVLFAGGKEPTHEYFTTSDGIKIHYMRLGDKGSPVVLIHGYTGSAEGNWFRNGIAVALSKNHRVVAIDCRNHGRSDKPQRGGAGKPDDVIELMDHLKIAKAHIHGYSMGGSITARLLATHPGRFLTASFGGSGIRESDPEWIRKVPADKTGRDPQEDEASRALRIRNAVDNGASKEDAEKSASAPRPATPARSGLTVAPLQIDLTKVTIPVLAINGEFDRPIEKTVRMSRELKNFKSVVLPGKSHLTAIAAPYIPKEYELSLVGFMNKNDKR
ncbi:MAG: alpha/beta hydrolase [Candidatus Solibacter usitatus]|nr:alpha/beta hydrolase [Candidatus Solibacter usitatus]